MTLIQFLTNQWEAKRIEPRAIAQEVSGSGQPHDPKRWDAEAVDTAYFRGIDMLKVKPERLTVARLRSQLTRANRQAAKREVHAWQQMLGDFESLVTEYGLAENDLLNRKLR